MSRVKPRMYCTIQVVETKENFPIVYYDGEAALCGFRVPVSTESRQAVIRHCQIDV